MAVTAVLCILLGVYPAPLYALLPYEVDFAPYTTTHVVTQLQLLMCAALAFTFLMRTGLYPAETRSVNLDSDWIYRRLLPAGVHRFMRAGTAARERLMGGVNAILQSGYRSVVETCGPASFLARTWSTGGAVLWVAAILGVFLLVYLS